MNKARIKPLLSSGWSVSSYATQMQCSLAALQLVRSLRIHLIRQHDVSSDDISKHWIGSEWKKEPMQAVVLLWCCPCCSGSEHEASSKVFVCARVGHIKDHTAKTHNPTNHTTKSHTTHNHTANNHTTISLHKTPNTYFSSQASL